MWTVLPVLGDRGRGGHCGLGAHYAGLVGCWPPELGWAGDLGGGASCDPLLQLLQLLQLDNHAQDPTDSSCNCSVRKSEQIKM